MKEEIERKEKFRREFQKKYKIENTVRINSGTKKQTNKETKIN